MKRREPGCRRNGASGRPSAWLRTVAVASLALDRFQPRHPHHRSYADFAIQHSLVAFRDVLLIDCDPFSHPSVELDRP